MRLRRPGYAEIVATLALFLALGGVGYAATHLSKNSVGTAQLKKGAVTGPKIAAAAKTELRGQAGERGPVGPPGPADGAAGGALAGSYPNPRLAPAESVRSPGPLEYHCFEEQDWREMNEINPNFVKPGFYRDPYGAVHLQGAVTCGFTPVPEVTIFILPPGYRPRLAEFFAVAGANGPTEVEVASNGDVIFHGTGALPGPNDYLDLAGIAFRCEPSGVEGCP